MKLAWGLAFSSRSAVTQGPAIASPPSPRIGRAVVLAMVLGWGQVGTARADEPPKEASPAQQHGDTPEDADDAPPERPKLTVIPIAYVEAYYAYNLNRPENGITAFRGFDNRHNTFSLSNAAFGAEGRAGPVEMRLVMQVGSTPSSYYLAEGARAGGAGANATGPELWKYLQEANITATAPVGRGLRLQLGLIPSPIGYEVFAVKDNWNWSRSNLFFGLPFYHTGLRITYAWTDALSSSLAIFNGWNAVVDNNDDKSLSAHLNYKDDDWQLQLLYFGGNERTSGAPEGPHVRHHVDLFGQVDATSWLSFVGQVDYGWEPTRMGTARWMAGAAYARVKPVDRVYVALRADRFYEHLATQGGLSSAPIFWGGSEWVSSGTATLDVRPAEDHVSVRLEYRHDMADIPLYFAPNVVGDGVTSPYRPNARTQDTLLLGATAWF